MVKKSEPATPVLMIHFFTRPSGKEPRESVWMREAEVGRLLEDGL